MEPTPVNPEWIIYKTKIYFLNSVLGNKVLEWIEYIVVKNDTKNSQNRLNDKIKKEIQHEKF